MKRIFAPGCALALYKPDVARRLREYLEARHGPIGEHLTCCRHEPGLGAGTQVGRGASAAATASSGLFPSTRSKDR